MRVIFFGTNGLEEGFHFWLSWIYATAIFKLQKSKLEICHSNFLIPLHVPFSVIPDNILSLYTGTEYILLYEQSFYKVTT
jgi:hypothetical protein